MGYAQQAAQGQDLNRRLTFGGHVRSYRVYLPPQWAPGAMLPVLLVFHGGGGTGAGMERLSHASDVAAQQGFIAVYPDGYERSWADARGTTRASRAGIDDVGFVAAMLDAVTAEFGIDATRVYATGLSNGAIFTERLGCELADQIAGIAPVAGTMPPGEAADCRPSRPVSVLLMHGTDDPLVPYGGGEIQGAVGGTVLSATQTFSVWTQVDGCSGQPVTGQLPDRAGDGTLVQTQTVFGCNGGTAVALYTIQGGGHTWPGGEQYAPVRRIGRTTHQFDATEAAWQFFTGVPNDSLRRARPSEIDRRMQQPEQAG